jgi:hypothetical protein
MQGYLEARKGLRTKKQSAVVFRDYSICTTGQTLADILRSPVKFLSCVFHATRLFVRKLSFETVSLV